MRKDRARKQVLWYICQFSLGVEIDGSSYSGLRETRFRPTNMPKIGSLVALQSMRDPDFYLGWVHEVKVGKIGFDTVYTVESLETGELIDWSNVSVLEYDSRTTDEHPEWRWTDEQWSFKDRWDRLCYKERDAYIVLPLFPEFDGDAVTLGTRIRHGWGDPPPSKRFEAWQAVTDDDMLAYYDASVAANDAAKPARAAEAGN